MIFRERTNPAEGISEGSLSPGYVRRTILKTTSQYDGAQIPRRGPSYTRRPGGNGGALTRVGETKSRPNKESDDRSGTCLNRRTERVIGGKLRRLVPSASTKSTQGRQLRASRGAIKHRERKTSQGR